VEEGLVEFRIEEGSRHEVRDEAEDKGTERGAGEAQRVQYIQQEEKELK